jgi:Protein of unknown function (DUF3618)
VSADGSRPGGPASTPGGPASTADGPQLPSDPVVLERAIEQRRAQLAATVDELVVRTSPREVVRRGMADLSRRLRRATRTPEGGWRVERIGAVAAAVLAVVGLAVLLRRRND